MDRRELAVALRLLSVYLDVDLSDREMVVDALDALGCLPPKRSMPVNLESLSDHDVMELRELAAGIWSRR